ncbi:MAG: phosphate ABC transporter permease subunit PstC [Myxococcales bacterium]|nr:phosphate ABC transporter permease subunit PstC [Myxococcales bacterium]
MLDATASALRTVGTESEPAPRAAGGGEKLIETLLLLCAVLSIITTIGVLAVLLFETVSFFTKVSFSQFFADAKWTPLFANKHFGIWPLVSGTLLTSVIAISVALPLGLMAAIYLSEFAGPRTRAFVKPTLELLAGVPTIVYGYFALVFLTPILQAFMPQVEAFNALSPGLIMGIMIMPMISSLSEDALHAVPNELREGAYGLGASKLSTIFRVVVPAAKSGVVAAVTLAVSRAIGETMIVTIAGGAQPNFTFDPRGAVETMTAFIISVSKGDTPTGTIEYQTIFAVGSMLFLMTFTMNFITQRLLRSSRGKGL